MAPFEDDEKEEYVAEHSDSDSGEESAETVFDEDAVDVARMEDRRTLHFITAERASGADVVNERRRLAFGDRLSLSLQVALRPLPTDW